MQLATPKTPQEYKLHVEKIASVVSSTGLDKQQSLQIANEAVIRRLDYEMSQNNLMEREMRREELEEQRREEDKREANRRQGEPNSNQGRETIVREGDRCTCMLPRNGSAGVPRENLLALCLGCAFIHVPMPKFFVCGSGGVH
jgi:hypothetical protein